MQLIASNICEMEDETGRLFRSGEFLLKQMPLERRKWGYLLFLSWNKNSNHIL